MKTEEEKAMAESTADDMAKPKGKRSMAKKGMLAAGVVGTIALVTSKVRKSRNS